MKLLLFPMFLKLLVYLAGIVAKFEVFKRSVSRVKQIVKPLNTTLCLGELQFVMVLDLLKQMNSGFPPRMRSLNDLAFSFHLDK